MCRTRSTRRGQYIMTRVERLPVLLVGIVFAASVWAGGEPAETLYFLAMAKLDRGEKRDAYDLLKRVPTAPEVDLERSSYKDIGYRRELIQLLVTEGTEGLDPTFNIGKLKQALRARAQTRMAEIHMERGQYAKAIELLRAARRADKNYPMAHCRMAECFLAVGEPAEAVNAAKEAYLLSPTYRLYRQTYATALATDAERVQQAGETGKALLAYDFAFEIDPLNAVAMSNYGYYLYQGGDPRPFEAPTEHAAIRRYNRLKGLYLIEESAELAPDRVPIQVRAGEVFWVEKRPARALSYFAHALDLDSKNLEALQGAVRCLLALHEHRRAADLAKEGLRAHKGDLELRSGLAEAYLGLKEFDQAIDTARAVLKKDRSSARAYLVLGTARLATGKTREGTEALRKAIELGGTSLTATRAAMELNRAELSQVATYAKKG